MFSKKDKSGFIKISVKNDRDYSLDIDIQCGLICL